jgi:hypothetical protein
MDKLATLAPGRLSARLREGLRGHHPLFEPEQIQKAFEGPEAAVTRDEADAVGKALLAICRDPFDLARLAVDGLPEPARLSLIRLYFRLLDRAGEELSPKQ